MAFATINPATGKTEKEFPSHTPEEVEALLQRAAAAFAEYRTTTYAERSRHLITAAELLEGEVPDIARILTTEMGKTFAAAKGEVAKCAVGLRWFADHAEALLADEPIPTSAASTAYVHYQPLGPGARRHAVELPAVAGRPVRRPRAHGRATSACSSTRPTCPRPRSCLEDLFRRAGLPDGVFTNLFVGSKDVARPHRRPAGRRGHPDRQRAGRHVGRRRRRAGR